MEIKEDDVERNEMDETADGKTPTKSINLPWPIIYIATDPQMGIPRACFENGQSSVRNENQKQLHHNHHHHIHLRTSIPPHVIPDSRFGRAKSSDGTGPDN